VRQRAIQYTGAPLPTTHVRNYHTLELR